MDGRKAIWFLGLAANPAATCVLLYWLFDDPPWERYGMDDDELLGFVLAAFYVMVNWYFVFRATDDETLLGLWIRAKKKVLQRQIEDGGDRS